MISVETGESSGFSDVFAKSKGICGP
jgi:hypothetical protein